MNIGFAILAHDHPLIVARLARRLLDANGIVAIHYDAKRGEEPIEAIWQSLGDLSDRVVWARRINVGWGQWSMIEATLNAVRAIFDAGHEPDYIHLMSASEYPIRPLQEFQSFLERYRGMDFIESYPIDRKNWVRNGISHERYQYRHLFNFKKHPRLFSANWNIQKALGMKRNPPADLVIHMGSQWCTLTGESWKRILERAKSEEVRRFFKLSWIPDEMFLQTMLAGGKSPHSNRHLTLYQFTDYGVPVVYCNGHAAHLARQPFFFARKISPYAGSLRDELDQLASENAALGRLTDAEIGTPTDEYQDFRLNRRQGIAGKRVVGHVRDEWYGDLEWNRKPYVAFLGACAEELNCLAKAIDELPGFIGHGSLFATDRIHFAGGVPRLAGYGVQDTILRDHKRPNFLVDVINQFPDEITAFAVSWNEEQNIFWNEDQNVFDVLRFDRNCLVVIVRGNILRSFVEWKLPAGTRADEESGRRNVRIEAEPDEFMKFCARYSDYYNNRKKLIDEAGSRYLEIDLNEQDWRSSLVKFMMRGDPREGGSVFPETRVLTNSSAFQNLRDPSSTLSNGYELVGLIPDRALRDRHFGHMLGREGGPYLVLAGASSEEIGFLAEILNDTKQFRFRGVADRRAPYHVPTEMNGVADSQVNKTTKYNFEQLDLIRSRIDDEDGAIPGFYFCGMTYLDNCRYICFDQNARILIVKGNVMRAIGEFWDIGTSEPPSQGYRKTNASSSPWCDPSKFEFAYSCYLQNESGKDFRKQAGTAVVFEIDLMKAGWREEICVFLEGVFPTASGTELREAFYGESCSERTRQLSDPGAIYSNARYLCSRILDEVHRDFHLSKLRRAEENLQHKDSSLPKPETGDAAKHLLLRRSRVAAKDA